MSLAHKLGMQQRTARTAPPATTLTQPLSDAERARVCELIKAAPSVRSVVESTGISRTVLLSAAAGVPLQRGSIALLRGVLASGGGQGSL